MKKITLAAVVLVATTLAFSACSKMPKTDSKTDTQDRMMKQATPQPETGSTVDSEATPTPQSTATDVGSLEKDLGSMKLEEETFQ